MRKIVIGSAAVVATSIALILVIPQFINWSAYREEIARAAGDAIGRPVTIDGSVGLRLLPAPALSVSNVRVAAPSGFDGAEMASLERLDVRIALAPLLNGRVKVENVALVRPRVTVERNPSGVLNWSHRSDVPDDEATTTPDVIARPSGNPRGLQLVDTMSFDQIEVDDAQITYIDRVANRRETVGGIDLDIVAGSVTGPFQIVGDVTYREVPIHVEATTGRFAAGAAVPLRLTLGLPGGEPERLSGLRFAGIVGNGEEPAAATEAPPSLRGDLRVETPDLHRMIGPFLAAFGVAPDGRTAERLGRPFTAHTAVEASEDRVKLGNLELTLGDTAASGHAGYMIGAAGPDGGGRGQGELTLAVNRLNLDEWLGVAVTTTKSGAAKTGANKAAPSTAAARPGAEAPSATMPTGGFGLPTDLSFRLDLSLDAATLSEGVLRQARLEAMLEDGQLAINRLSAQLPGGSLLSSAGRLSAVGGAPKLDLRVEASSDNLRAALEWLGVDTAGVPAERLRKSVLTAIVSAKPDRLELTDIDLELDTSRVAGAVAVERRERPAIGARLTVDNFNLDAYLPVSDVATPPSADSPDKENTSEASAPAESPPGSRLDALAAALKLADVNIDARLERLTIGGDLIRDVRLDLTAANGAIDAREISFKDWAGVSARIGGQAAGLSPPRNAHVTINAAAESLAPLAQAAPFGLAWPVGAPTPESLGRTALQARLAGDGDRLTIEGALEIAGATLELGGTVTHPLAMTATERGGDGTVDLTGRLRHPDADSLLALVGARAPGGPGPMDVFAHLTGGGARAALSGIEGVIGATPIAGEVRIDGAGIRPRVEASLRTGTIDIARLSGGGRAATNGGGPGTATTPAPEATATGGGFDLGMLDRVDGNLSTTIARLDLGEVALDQFAATAQLDNGKLTVDRFDAEVMSGRVGGRAEITAPRDERPGGMAFAATAEGLVPTQPVPLGPLALTGGTAAGEIDVAAVGADTAAWMDQLTGTARIAVRDGVLRGIDLAAIRGLLKGDGRPADLLQGVARGLRTGETGFANLDGSFRIDHGVIETNDTRLESVPASVSAVGTVDLPRRLMDMTLTVDLAVDPAPPPISVRLQGPLGAPDRKLDADALKRMVIERATGEALRQVLPKGSDTAPLEDAIQRPLGDILRRLGR